MPDLQADSLKIARIRRTNIIASSDIRPEKRALEGYRRPEAPKRAGFEKSRHRSSEKLRRGTEKRGSDPREKRPSPSCKSGIRRHPALRDRQRLRRISLHQRRLDTTVSSSSQALRSHGFLRARYRISVCSPFWAHTRDAFCLSRIDCEVPSRVTTHPFIGSSVPPQPPPRRSPLPTRWRSDGLGAPSDRVERLGIGQPPVEWWIMTACGRTMSNHPVPPRQSWGGKPSHRGVRLRRSEPCVTDAPFEDLSAAKTADRRWRAALMICRENAEAGSVEHEDRWGRIGQCRKG
jgi:hypothetical protein